MPRANSSVPRHRRHRKIVKQAKGYYGARSRTFKSAKDAVVKAGLYAYRDRRQRKRQFRRLWITRINAACRLNGTTYSAFINAMKIKGIELAHLTLHIGLGTFRPVEVEDLSKHKMDSEELFISDDTADLINNGIKEKKKICAVGTTSMRGVETSVTTQGLITPYSGWTNKFIYPPYDFRIANCMITNFHTPKSTLLMMVSAFGGHDLIMGAYEEAVKEKYKFFSYGDAMLIL